MGQIVALFIPFVSFPAFYDLAWWRHQMEIFFVLLAICAGNSPVPMNSPHKGQWRGALMFSLICVWINGWVNNRKAGDLRRYRAHYDATVIGVMFYAAILSWVLIKADCMLYAVTMVLWYHHGSVSPTVFWSLVTYSPIPVTPNNKIIRICNSHSREQNRSSNLYVSLLKAKKFWSIINHDCGFTKHIYKRIVNLVTQRCLSVPQALHFGWQ